MTEGNPTYSLKFTVVKSTDRVVKAQYNECVSEYFQNKIVNEYNQLRIRYFDRKAFDQQLAQLSQKA